MFNTLFDNSTGKFKDVDLFVYDDNHFTILGYQFTLSNSLKDKVQFMTSELNGKHVNVRIQKMNGNTVMSLRDLKTHMTFEMVKRIKVEELSNFFIVTIYI